MLYLLYFILASGPHIQIGTTHSFFLVLCLVVLGLVLFVVLCVCARAFFFSLAITSSLSVPPAQAEEQRWRPGPADSQCVQCCTYYILYYIIYCCTYCIITLFSAVWIYHIIFHSIDYT